MYVCVRIYMCVILQVCDKLSSTETSSKTLYRLAVI